MAIREAAYSHVCCFVLFVLIPFIRRYMSIKRRYGQKTAIVENVPRRSQRGEHRKGDSRRPRKIVNNKGKGAPLRLIWDVVGGSLLRFGWYGVSNGRTRETAWGV